MSVPPKPAKSTLVKPAVRGHVALKNACVHLSATDMPAKEAFHSKTAMPTVPSTSSRKVTISTIFVFRLYRW